MANKVELKELTSVLHHETAFLMALNDNLKRLQAGINDSVSRTAKPENKMLDVIDMNGNRITNVGDPVESTDAVTYAFISQYIEEMENVLTRVKNLIAQARKEIKEYAEVTVYPVLNRAIADAERIKNEAAQILAETKMVKNAAENACLAADRAREEAVSAQNAARQSAQDAHVSELNAAQSAEDAAREIPEIRETAERALEIAQGRSRSHVFNTLAEMEEWLRDASHKEIAEVGDNLYIIETSVPDYWISAILSQPSPEGYWFSISVLGADTPVITNMVTTDTAQDITAPKNFTDNLTKNGVRVATATDVQVLNERIDQVELSKAPNAVIIGEPIINNGQISGFSEADYLQFPFILDVQNRPFRIEFSFTTGSDVTTQQNILDSEYGLALAIKNGYGLMAASSTGTNWNIGQSTGSLALQSNTTYYARLTWNRLLYKTELSTNGVDYTTDMQLTAAVGPYPRTIFIGGSYNLFGPGTSHPFHGSINLNKAFLYIADQLFWQGMDDAGLLTRADTSLSNLDAEGHRKLREVISDSTVSATETWSSEKINGIIGNVEALINAL